MKNKIAILIGAFFLCLGHVFAQSADQHFSKLVLNKKEKKVFHSKDKDSTITLRIDTLIMKDKSSLQFYGEKDVKLVIGYAEIGNNAFISGNAGKNNASNFDIDIYFQRLGSLYIIAKGRDANNGTRTDPNGDGGNITLTYAKEGITPQTESKKEKHYLHMDASPGGLHVVPASDLRVIYDQIKHSPPGRISLPQGQVYSGSPGKEGKIILQSK